MSRQSCTIAMYYVKFYVQICFLQPARPVCHMSVSLDDWLVDEGLVSPTTVTNHTVSCFGSPFWVLFLFLNSFSVPFSFVLVFFDDLNWSRWMATHNVPIQSVTYTFRHFPKLTSQTNLMFFWSNIYVSKWKPIFGPKSQFLAQKSSFSF